MKVRKMNKEKNQLVEQTPEQANPYLAQPSDFEIAEVVVPFHSQCGSDKREYQKLLKESEDAGGKSNFVGEQDRPTEASDAGKPHTEGIGDD